MSPGATWAWLLHRVTAVLLVPLLALHFAIMHFVDPTETITFAGSALRLQGALYLVVDTLLLTSALYHGLNGVRNVVLDYWPRAARAAAWMLGVLGLLALVYGTSALLAFARGA